MSHASALLARACGLPRAQTEDVVREKNLRVTMDDGAVLLADRWVARTTRHAAQPTVLVRSPYGRRHAVGLVFGRILAERGLQVLVQSVRGTFDSDGRFDPFDERADGLATLDWIRAQPWHAERIALLGASYLGTAMWAAAPGAGDDIAALAIQVGPSSAHHATFPGGSPALETAGSWLALIDGQDSRVPPLGITRAVARLPKLFMRLPLGEFDVNATGAEVRWFRTALASPRRDDPYWAARDHAPGVSQVTAPVQLVGGWYDIFLPSMLEDHAARQAAGLETQLIIGPWTHTSPGLIAASLREATAWLRAHVLDDRRLVQPDAIRVRVTGEDIGDGWRSLESWPPPGIGERRLWVAGDGELLLDEPAAAPGGGDGYRYDPAHPTPAFGGPHLLARLPVVDNRRLELRSDVLTYTTEPLTTAVEAIGVARVELHVRASEPHFDLFARVCDVGALGMSRNVCDALTRISPECFEPAADGSWRVAFDLWPMAHRFAEGHRIRLQVSSGAHPRYARNPGTGEDPVTATALRAVDVELLHGAQHPSVLVLPTAAGPH